jgi:hypothetical protein
MANGYNMFKVLQPILKDTFTPKKLKPPKPAKIPVIKGQPKIPKVNGGY